MHTRGFTVSRVVGLAFAGLALFACHGQSTADASGEVLGQTASALSTASIKWLNGTYGAGCTDRSGSWSLRLGGAQAMDNPGLSVVTNDTGCVLTLTELVADATYVASPSIILDTSYAASASSFAPGGASTVSFYGNAILSSKSFANSFTVGVAFSDDPRAGSGGVTGTYSGVSATSSVTSVSSPDYTLSLISGSLAFQVDVNHLVTSSSGTADLTDGSATASSYVIDVGTLPASPTFDDYDAAYVAGTPVMIGGANPSVAASALLANGTDVSSPVVRTIILRRATSGVPAYQAFKVTFTSP
jgi:hypothetical protein